MISFKLFANTLQEAIVTANNTLMDKNRLLLDQYFIDSHKENEDNNENSDSFIPKLMPKSVVFEYPQLQSDGTVKKLKVAVPLITLVPLSMLQIENVTFNAHFKMKIKDDELQIDIDKNIENKLQNYNLVEDWGKIEMSFTPQQTKENTNELIIAYETNLKKQMI